MTETQQTSHVAISAKDYAQRYSLSHRTIFRLSAEGKLPRPVRIGRATRWRLADIELWEKLGCPDRQKFEALQKEESVTKSHVCRLEEGC